MALPRAWRFGWLERFRSPWWALVPAGSIVVVIGIVAWQGESATALSWLALARGAAVRRARARPARARRAARVGGGGPAALPDRLGRPRGPGRRDGGDDADRPRLHRPRLAARLGRARPLAEVGDLRDGRGRHLVRRRRPAPGPQRRAHRRRPERPAEPPGRPLRRRRDGLRRPLRRRHPRLPPSPPRRRAGKRPNLWLCGPSAAGGAGLVLGLGLGFDLLFLAVDTLPATVAFAGAGAGRAGRAAPAARGRYDPVAAGALPAAFL